MNSVGGNRSQCFPSGADPQFNRYPRDNLCLYIHFYVGFPKGKSHILSSSAMWIAGGMVEFVHESETSRMDMRNANYFLGFNHSILKVFIHKYR